MTTLAVLTPIDPGTNARVTVRVCSSQDPDATGADDQIWWPAIVSQPVLSMNLFDGDFTSAVEPASGEMAIRLDVLRNSGAFPRAARYDWSGAGVTIYRLVAGAPVFLAEMRVERFASEDDVLSVSMAVDKVWAEADVLFNRYAGTTGAEGGADLKDQPKPWAFGRCLNVEPVFIDQIDNVWQVSGYGAVSAIPAVYERGASFGASIGNFASYAALIAADIPEGRWGTCLAEGMFRLGAPPAGVITCDVDGDTTSGFLRRTGAIISEIARRMGVTAKINATSLAALDTAVARNVNIVISQQVSLLDLARAMAAPCNAVGGLALDGRLIMPRVAFGSEQFVIDAQGRQMPPVLGVARQNTRPPYAEIRMGAAQSHRVHSFEEIAFFADLIDRGLYDAGQTYREGNIVERVDKSRWVYVNPTASSGNAPPIWPTTSNSFWANLSPPASEDPAISNGSITINEDGEIDGIGDGNGTPVGNGQVVLEGAIDDRPGGGNFIGQLYSATDTREVFRWDGTNWIGSADITAVAQRSIEPQFPVIEVKEGEAGHTGNRTVTHVAKRGTGTLTGGTWSLLSENLGTGDATINSSTGTVTLSGIVQSGAYSVRYTHTDSVATDLAVNVTFVPAPAAGGGGAKAGRATSSTGTLNDNNWNTILTLTITGAPAGRVGFGSFEGLSYLNPLTGTGTADFEARLQLDGVTLTSVGSQNVVTGGVITAADFALLFDGRFNVTAGNRTFTIQLRRTSGTGVISTTDTVLEATIIAT